MSEAPPVDCAQLARVLYPYLDGEVGEQQRQLIDQHVSLCRGCSSRVEFEQRLRAHLVDLGREAVPMELEQRIRVLIDRFTWL